MTMGPAPMCFFCRHFRPGKETDTCRAFPEGIPTEIFQDLYDHRKPFPGDAGLMFEPKDVKATIFVKSVYGGFTFFLELKEK